MTPKRPRRRYTTDFKAEVALATSQIIPWKLQLCEQVVQVFAEAPVAGTPVPDLEPLYAAIGRLQMKNALLKKTLSR